MSYVQQARAAAERLIENLGVRSSPVDVEGIAAALQLTVVHEDLGDDVSGLLVSRGRSAGIAVKRNDPPVRRRFTIAHEIGHFVLGHHLQRKELVHADQHHHVVYRSQTASQGLDPLEIQANQFAAALLMPTKLLRQQIEALEKPLRDEDVRKLARQFRVSEQAMTIRLTTLSLL